MREGFTPSVERPMNYKKERKQELSVAELLFDEINTEIQRSNKGKEKDKKIKFIDHPRYGEWKALRDANVAESLRADSTKRESDFRNAHEQEMQDSRAVFNDRADEKNRELTLLRAQAQEAAASEAKRAEVLAVEEAKRKDLESLSIDRFYRDGKKIDSAHASQKDAGNLLLGKKDAGLSVAGRLVEDGFEGEEAKRQINSIIKDMGQLKNVYSVQIKSLQEMGLVDRIMGRRAALEKQMAETQADILLKSEALLKEFKVSGKVFAQQEMIVERLWDLSKKLENKVSVGEAVVALTVLAAILAGGASEVAKKVSAADDFRAPAVASYDTFGDSNLDQDSFTSDLVEGKVSGYKVSSETVSSSAESESKVTKELFSLTPEESDKVKSFKDWRRAILNPEFIGKEKKDGSVPTTERGRNVAPGTQLEISVDGNVLIAGEVEKYGSIWGVLEENKNEIKKVAKEKGWGNLDLRIIESVDSKDGESKIKGKVAHDKEKGDSNKSRKDIAKVGAADTGSEDENPALKEAARHSANDRLGEIGVRHQIGHDYPSLDGYQGAIDELKKIKNIDASLENPVKAEIKRLETAKEDLKNRLVKAKGEAEKYIESKGVKHTVGLDYKTIKDYDQAIDELSQIEGGIVLPPIVDMQQTDDSKRMSQIKDGVRAERERLETAKQNLRLKQIQAGIDNESSVPEAGKPEKLDFKPSLKVSDLMSDAELSLAASGEMYGRNLVKAHNLTSSVFEYLGGEDQHLFDSLSEKDLRKFLGMVEEAKSLYNLVLTVKEDGKIKPNPTTIEQAKKGQEIAGKLAIELDDAIPKNSVDKAVVSAGQRLEILYKETESRTGNVALYGPDGALDTLQKVMKSIKTKGKIGSSDRKILKKIESTAHTVLHSDNNLEPDKKAAKEVLAISVILKGSISKRDQNRVEKEESAGLGVRYELPKPADQRTDKDLNKLLSNKVKDQINQAYELAEKLSDDSPSSDVAYDLVSAAALLEQLLLRPMELGDIQDKLSRAEDLISKTQAKVGNSKIYPREYTEALSQLNSAFIGTRDSLIKTEVIKQIDKRVAPVEKIGKRVADRK